MYMEECNGAGDLRAKVYEEHKIKLKACVLRHHCIILVIRLFFNLSPVTCYVSPVICHISHVTFCMSHVTIAFHL